ncbi:MAG: PASTA domain-containing protein [Oscillospiraceae bacterium]|nr:PASTA domain-containing protein [Oscillospiraceae bacterium]
MSDNKSSDNLEDLMKAVTVLATGIAGIVVGVYKLSKPVIDDVSDKAGVVIEHRRSLIQIPDLCNAGMLYNVNEAVEVLNASGLRYHLVETKIQEADVKFCDYFDGQVILTIPHANKKVEPGTSVEVKYITQEVIDESKRILAEQEQRKELLALEKSEKRAERSEKAKQMVSNAIETTKSGVAKIPVALHKNKRVEEQTDQQAELIEQTEDQSETEE